MKIELTSVAKKQLKKLPKSEIKKISRKLLSLRSNSFLGKRLKGELQNEYSLKAWPYRIIYIVPPKKDLVQIEDIRHRQGVYKK